VKKNRGEENHSEPLSAELSNLKWNAI